MVCLELLGKDTVCSGTPRKVQILNLVYYQCLCVRVCVCVRAYCISSNKRRGVYYIFHDLDVAFIRGRRLFKMLFIFSNNQP